MEELVTALDWFGPAEFYLVMKTIMIGLGLYFFNLLIRAGIIQLLIIGPIVLYWNRKDKKKEEQENMEKDTDMLYENEMRLKKERNQDQERVTGGF